MHGFTLRAGKSTLKIHTLELKVASDARACRLGSDWKNSVTPVADHPPKEIEAKCIDWNGKKYFCSETPTNFNDAQKLAMQLQGRLVTISSREEETFLATHFPSRYLWLSAWRKGINPAWHDERNRLWKYQPTWASGQPNFGPFEFFATYCTFDASTGHLPGMNDVHAPVNFLVPCIEWGEEYPAAP